MNVRAYIFIIMGVVALLFAGCNSEEWEFDGETAEQTTNFLSVLIFISSQSLYQVTVTASVEEAIYQKPVPKGISS